MVDQRPLGGNSRSTVGTISDIYALVRTAFSRESEPSAGPPGAYSFNDPSGMCTGCDGLGRVLRPDLELMIDRSESIATGAILVPGHTIGGPGHQHYANYEGLDNNKKISAYTKAELKTLLYGTEGDSFCIWKRGRRMEFRYEGLVVQFVRRYLKADDTSRSDKSKAAVEKFVSEGACPDCDGARLNPAALASRLGGRGIAEWCGMQIGDLAAFAGSLAEETRSAILREVADRLARIEAIGLGYLTLDRPRRRCPAVRGSDSSSPSTSTATSSV